MFSTQRKESAKEHSRSKLVDTSNPRLWSIKMEEESLFGKLEISKKSSICKSLEDYFLDGLAT